MWKVFSAGHQCPPECTPSQSHPQPVRLASEVTIISGSLTHTHHCMLSGFCPSTIAVHVCCHLTVSFCDQNLHRMYSMPQFCHFLACIYAWVSHIPWHSRFCPGLEGCLLDLNFSQDDARTILDTPTVFEQTLGILLYCFCCVFVCLL